MTAPDTADPGYQRRALLAQRALDKARARLTNWRRWRTINTWAVILLIPVLFVFYYMANARGVPDSLQTIGTTGSVIFTIAGVGAVVGAICCLVSYFDGDIAEKLERAQYHYEDVIAGFDGERCYRCSGTGIDR